MQNYGIQGPTVDEIPWDDADIKVSSISVWEPKHKGSIINVSPTQS